MASLASRKRRRPDEDYEEGVSPEADAKEELGHLIKSTNRLAQLSDEQLYNTFYVPVLRKHVGERPGFRDELYKDGGPNQWTQNRMERFLKRQRQPDSECSEVEMQLRHLETRITLELCYRGNVDAGIRELVTAYPDLARQIRLEEYRKYYDKSSRSFNVRSYQLPKQEEKMMMNFSNDLDFGDEEEPAPKPVVKRTPTAKEGGGSSAPVAPPVDPAMLQSTKLWTPREVAKFLANLGCPEAESRVEKYKVHGENLLRCTDNDLKDKLGIQKKGDRARILGALTVLAKRG